MGIFGSVASRQSRNGPLARILRSAQPVLGKMQQRRAQDLIAQRGAAVVIGRGAADPAKRGAGQSDRSAGWASGGVADCHWLDPATCGCCSRYSAATLSLSLPLWLPSVYQAENCRIEVVRFRRNLPSPAGRCRGWGSKVNRPRVSAGVEPPSQPFPNGKGIACPVSLTLSARLGDPVARLRIFGFDPVAAGLAAR